MWYPDWQLLRSGVSPDSPAQAVDPDDQVVAVNSLAAATGIRVGMRRREAEGICPVVVTVKADPGAEATAFEAIMEAVEVVIPRVEVVTAGLLFAPVAGAVTYYGSEQIVLDSVSDALASVGYPQFRIGLANGPFAAQRAAEAASEEHQVLVVQNDAAFLASLDVAELGHEDLAATFRWLGITTLGALAEMPRDAIASRFGPTGVAAHSIARGDDRLVRARTIPQDRTIEEIFSPPLENLEQASFAARALASRVIAHVAAEGVAPFRVEVIAESGDGEVRSRTVRSIDPFNDITLADRVRWQLRAWLEGGWRTGGGISGGLSRLRLIPSDLTDEGRQLALGEDAASAAEARRALAQCQTIVGPDAVLQAVPQGGRDPTEQVLWYRWGEETPTPEREVSAPWPGRLPSPAPALAPPEPASLEVEWDAGLPTRVRLRSRWEPVLNWAGPWRKVGRWWEGETNADRYQLVTSAGAMLIEIRDSKSYLLGVYD